MQPENKSGEIAEEDEMKGIYTVEELRKKLGVDEIEITARQEAMDTSGNFREVKIYHRSDFTNIQINQKEV